MLKFNLVFIIIIVFSVIACKESFATDGISRPRGTSLGDRIERVIGEKGGSILYEDGKFEVVIPAGALHSDVTVGVEPISRTLNGGIAKNDLPSYRLTPHGQKFLKPITIIFHYTEEEFKKLSPAESLAFQDNNGKWIGFRNMVKTDTERTVSVQTNHFSDWATYESIYIEPTENIVVEVGKTVKLNVMTVTPMGLTEEDQGNEEFYLEEPSLIPVAIDWRIINGPGNGTLVGVPAIATAIYTAPGSVPGNNPVEVEAKVNLKNKGYLLLLKTITVVERAKPGVHLKINGGAWIHFNDARSMINGESYVGDDGEYPYDRHSIYIRIAGGHAKGVGSWKWDDMSDGDSITTFLYVLKSPAPYTSYEHKYRKSDFDDWHMSPGYIRIKEYERDQSGQLYATGDFLIERSTPFIEGTSGTPPSSRIQGYFKLRVEAVRKIN